MVHPLARPSRRGSYAIVLALTLPVLMGFGALAVDISYMRLAKSQSQDVADAASQAALFALRQSGDQDTARAAATAVVSRNTIVGEAGTLTEIDFGTWSNSDRSFTADDSTPNAVRVTVERADAGLFLARIFGRETFSVGSTATSASRDLQVILVMDITGSWDWDDFVHSRDGALAFFDIMSTTYGPYDQIGMTLFLNRYGYEYTPMTLMSSAVSGSVRDDWEELAIASKAGYRDDTYSDSSWDHPCRYNERFKSTKKNDYNYPDPDGKGGCFPAMPRWYTDENGTDHSEGLQMAYDMLEELEDPDNALYNPDAYRAVVILTDGQPDNTSASSSSGAVRAAAGYVEDRWRFVKGTGKSVATIKSETIALAEDLYDDLEAHVWMVTFVSDSSWMESVPQGDGYYTVASSASQLEGIFEDIAQSLPMAIVE